MPREGGPGRSINGQARIRGRRRMVDALKRLVPFVGPEAAPDRRYQVRWDA
jgi:hypothetical protein